MFRSCFAGNGREAPIVKTTKMKSRKSYKVLKTLNSLTATIEVWSDSSCLKSYKILYIAPIGTCNLGNLPTRL
jgi:hypothetical protein